MKIESEKIFSESMIWEIQNETYSNLGLRAWSEFGVPFYLTSNPWIAESYFNIICAFLKDIQQDNITLIDLGAGSGRFAYLFLKAWEKNKLFNLKYIMTDIVESNRTFWKNNTRFQPFIDANILTFNIYPGSFQKLNEPCVIIANYFFDTIPQDLFRIKNNHIEEGKIALYKKESFLKNDPRKIHHIELKFQFSSFQRQYHSESWNKLLCDQLIEMKEGTLLFPKGALQTIDYFTELSDHPMLFISGDQAFGTLTQLKEFQMPILALHSTFSLPVSYYTLAKYYEKAFLPHNPSTAFTVMIGLNHIGHFHLKNTEAVFNETIGQCDPYQKELEMNRLESVMQNAKQFIDLMNFCAYDPIILNTHYEFLRSLIPHLSLKEKKLIMDIIEKVYQHFYPLNENEEVFTLNLGVLYFELKDYKKALTFFEKAQEIMGPIPLLINNIRETQRFIGI